MNTPLIGVTTHPQHRSEAAAPTWSNAAPYCDAVLASAGAPALISCTLPVESLPKLFERLDGLILTGGGDVHPRFYDETPIDALDSFDERRDQAEIALARWAMDVSLPTLGICRGVQVMNVALGGTLHQDISQQIPSALDHDHRDQARDKLAHTVVLDPTSRLTGLLKEDSLWVNSRHHQALKRLSPELRRSAWSEDDLTEAVEVPGHPFALGVQWHPEALPDRPESRALFRGLIEACHER
jgi:putative glutamine amidotransferase